MGAHGGLRRRQRRRQSSPTETRAGIGVGLGGLLQAHMAPTHRVRVNPRRSGPGNRLHFQKSPPTARPARHLPAQVSRSGPSRVDPDYRTRASPSLSTENRQRVQKEAVEPQQYATWPTRESRHCHLFYELERSEEDIRGLLPRAGDFQRVWCEGGREGRFDGYRV